MPSVFTFFNGMTLTDSQNRAIEAILAFLADEKARVFILKGYAGTGKTTIVKGLTDYLSSEKKTFHCLAPTGRAARVMSAKSGRVARTLHSEIFTKAKTTVNPDTQSFHTKFVLKDQTPMDGTIYMLDEASMLSDNESDSGENLNFGSGRNMADFFTYLKMEENSKTKVIFIGDEAQLPPVKSTFSPALDAQYIQTVFGYECREATLSDIVRYDNEILDAATLVRESITSKVLNSHIPLSAGDVEVVRGYQSLIKAYMNKVHDVEDTRSHMILAFSNSAVDQYNGIIREKLFPESKNELCAGDRIMIAANNYQGDDILMNGEFADILSVGRLEIVIERIKANYHIEERDSVKQVGQNEYEVELHFRDALIRVSGGTEQEVKLIENLFYSGAAGMTREVRQALFTNLWRRISEENPHKEKDEIKRRVETRISTDPYINAVYAKFGYAVTGHKAQGGEWNSVFVNPWGAKPDTLEHYRWIYTAYTRAARHLTIEWTQPVENKKVEEPPRVYPVRKVVQTTITTPDGKILSKKPKL